MILFGGESSKDINFMIEKLSFDSHCLTDIGATYIVGKNSQKFKPRTGKVVVTNRYSVFYNGVRIHIVNVVYEFI